MSFTRFHDDPCRVQKYLEETTNIGNYNLNVPGNGIDLPFINDPYVRMQKWGANLSNNIVNIDSDLKGLTRVLNRDDNKLNNYENNSVNYSINNYPIEGNEITHQPRATNPAWTLRELNSVTTPNVPNNFNYLHMNPQENVCFRFNNNISSRIVEKDYYRLNNN
tara:strand:+ start:3385 stop:3876 length:492 start_codon:yes stop_codon:yes gene_type:complete